MNEEKGQINWEVIVLLPISLIMLWIMFFVADPFIDELLPIFSDASTYPLGWLYKFLIQLLPLVVILLIFFRMKRLSERGRVARRV